MGERSNRPKSGSTTHYPFWFGGSASCFAACVTHPLDLGESIFAMIRLRAREADISIVKVRLQTQQHGVSQRNMLQMFIHIIKSDGTRGLYRGLSASLVRQLTYSTTRFAMYEEMKFRYTSPDEKPSMLALVAMSSTAGFMGGLVGNPADVLNVRMQHDAALPPEKRRNYRNVFNGFSRMIREEGARSIGRGILPNSIRAALMTASQLASYDFFKQMVISKTPLGDGLATHFTASSLAGLVATTVCSPVDVIKTRVMSSVENRAILPLLADICRKEGLSWIFKGWLPSFIRLGPHTIATFIFLEQHKKLYRALWAPPKKT